MDLHSSNEKDFFLFSMRSLKSKSYFQYLFNYLGGSFSGVSNEGWRDRNSVINSGNALASICDQVTIFSPGSRRKISFDFLDCIWKIWSFKRGLFIQGTLMEWTLAWSGQSDSPLSFNHFNTMLLQEKQCYDIFRYLLMYFDFKNTLRIICLE